MARPLSARARDRKTRQHLSKILRRPGLAKNSSEWTCSDWRVALFAGYEPLGRIPKKALAYVTRYIERLKTEAEAARDPGFVLADEESAP